LAKSQNKQLRADNAPEDAVSPIELALRNASDIVITLDNANVVESVSLNDASQSLGPLDHWCGQAIGDLLTEDSRPKLTKRLKALLGGEETVFSNIELNHFDGKHWKFPIRYTVQRLGKSGRSIMVGQDLRGTAEVQQQLVHAQLALEKEYEKQRDFETRYRVLRDNLSHAMMFIEASNGAIVDINALGATLLGGKVDGLSGLSVNSLLNDSDKGRALDRILRAATGDDPDFIRVVARKSGDSLRIKPRLFRSAGDMMILCHLESNENAPPASGDLAVALNTLYQIGSDAIVFTDAQGSIRHANEGFLALCDVIQIADLKGKQLGDFLLRGGIDQKVLLESTARTGRLKTFTTKLKSAHGGEVNVEIAATHLNDQPKPYFGFVLRNPARSEVPSEPADRSKSIQTAKSLVGTAPLKELVAATADVVEKMCIETAVELTNNNRVAAAELLGLSRQSFYVRLRKYDLLKKDEDEPS